MLWIHCGGFEVEWETVASRCIQRLTLSLGPQYDDLLSQFSSMQVSQSSSSHSLSAPESLPPQRSSSNIEQYIHDLDNNSFELDLQFSEEEKQLLLDKQTTGNPWCVCVCV